MSLRSRFHSRRRPHRNFFDVAADATTHWLECSQVDDQMPDGIQFSQPVVIWPKNLRRELRPTWFKSRWIACWRAIERRGRSLPTQAESYGFAEHFRPYESKHIGFDLHRRFVPGLSIPETNWPVLFYYLRRHCSAASRIGTNF